MCRKGAWAELTVCVPSMGEFRRKAHGFKMHITYQTHVPFRYVSSGFLFRKVPRELTHIDIYFLSDLTEHESETTGSDQRRWSAKNIYLCESAHGVLFVRPT